MSNSDGVERWGAVALQEIHDGGNAPTAAGACAAGDLYVAKRASAALDRLHDGAVPHPFAMTHDGHLDNLSSDE
ncbi:MAG TPA: hypothetical protein PK020_15570 [Ilumatobacteraceae bacterium]|nr:hypothetical protein [Ilumatobacteraceae bacterium]